VSELTTEALYRRFLVDRQAAPKFHPGEIRLSEVGACQRKASLRLLGREGAKPDLTQESIFASGDEHEERIAALWEAEFPGAVERQVQVASPFGVGHMDIWISPIRHYVEAKSTLLKHRRYLPFRSHVEQVTLYLHYYIVPRGGTAEIAYRIKETGEIVSVPVAYDADLAAQLVDRLQRLADARDLGVALPIPDDASPDRFPCGWMRDGKLVTCEFWHECWGVQGRTDDVGAMRLLARYRDAEAKVATARGQAAEAEEEREGVRAAMAMVMERLGQAVVHGDGYEVRRSVSGRWTAREMQEKEAPV